MKKIVVLGLGKSGLNAASFLISQGAHVLAVEKDLDKISERPEVISLLTKGMTLFSEKQDFCWQDVDFVVKSPGLLPSHPLVERAKQESTLIDEIDLGAQYLMQKGKTLFAITGTNGKTTTTEMVAHILQKSGKSAKVSGNLGVPLTLVAQEKKLADFYVVEISSFQLWALQGKYFDAGVLLNLSPNHLDWHGSFAAYAKTKRSLREHLKNKKNFFPPYLHDKHLEERVASIISSSYRICGQDLPTIGAAYALCQKAGVKEIAFWEALRTFKKPPHRLEFVKEKDGVVYINDSKATTIDAVIHGVKACSAPLILIAGGIHKGDDFKKWLPSFRQKVKKVFAIGLAREKIAEALEKDIEVEVADDLCGAMKKASKITCQGDTILLSPGCSSFDQFRDFEHRGEVFKCIVWED